jgi:hypothetical protein
VLCAQQAFGEGKEHRNIAGAIGWAFWHIVRMGVADKLRNEWAADPRYQGARAYAKIVIDVE